MKVETYKIKDWKEKETGLLIDENEDWVLVKHIPVDYVVDGYKIYKKSAIEKRKSKTKEEKIARVLRLKKIETKTPESLSLDSVLEILQWSEKKYGLFEFQDNEGDLFYGKLNNVKVDMFYIDLINSNGGIEKEYDYNFLIYEVAAIAFESDYFESIRLLMNDEIQKANPLHKV